MSIPSARFPVNISTIGGESAWPGLGTNRRKKPDPEIFLLAIRRLALSPGECLVVEDAPNGIRAGKAAGAMCLGLTTSFSTAELQAAGADWTAPDLAHVPPDVLFDAG